MNQRLSYSRLAVLGAAVFLLALVGCSGSSKVEGTVTYKGAPLEGASISLVDGSGNVVASGSTDSAGKFTLLNAQFKDTIPAGEYKAIVTKTTGIASGAPLMTEDGKYTPEAAKAMKAGGKGAMKNELPPKFAAADSTPFTVKIPPSGPINLNLDS